MPFEIIEGCFLLKIDQRYQSPDEKSKALVVEEQPISAWCNGPFVKCVLIKNNQILLFSKA